MPTRMPAAFIGHGSPMNAFEHHRFTEAHFVPLLYLAGMAAARGETARTLVDGCAMGSLSMISYTVGLDREVPPDSGRPAAEIPDRDVPPERTNT